MDKIRSYIFSRAFAAGLFTHLFRLLIFLLLLPGLLALSTFSPFTSVFHILGIVALFSAAIAFALAAFFGIRRRLEAALGGQPPDPGTGAAVTARGAHRAWGFLPLAAVALLPLFLTGCMLAATHLIWHARLDTIARTLKSRGLPATLADFREDHPPETYAYPDLEKALSRFEDDFLRSVPHQKTALKRWDRRMNDTSSAAVSHYEPFIGRDLLPLLPRYTRFRRIDYRTASQDPDTLPCFRSDKYFQVVRLLRLGALTRAYRGAVPEAWTRLDRLLAFADLVSRDHSLDVKMAVLSFRGQGVEAAITAMLNSPRLALPAGLSARLAAFQDDHLVRDGVRHELAQKLDFRKVYELPILLGRKKMVKLACLDHGERDYLEDLLNLGARALVLAGAFDAGYFKLAEFMANQGQDEALRYKESREAANWPFWPYGIAQFERPQYAGFYLKEREFKTWTRLALVMSALGKYRDARGAPPGRLEDLAPGYIAPAHLSDLVSGKPFEYSLRGGEASVCALGSKGNRKDSRGESFCVRRGS